jgi:hypothetical protein
MTPRTMRKAERAVHLLWALVLILSVYGLVPSWSEPVIRWVVIPGMVASGFAMWFAAPLRRLGRNARSSVGSAAVSDDIARRHSKMSARHG